MRISCALKQRGERLAAMAPALGAMLMIPAMTAAVVAQESRQIIVQDDGDGAPWVHQMTQPDAEALGTPEYVRSDLPIFYNTLELEIPQRLNVQTLLEDYLTSFKELMKDSKQQDGGGRLVRRAGQAGPGAGPGGGGGVDQMIEDLLGEVKLNAEGGGSISIDISDGGGGGDQPLEGFVTSSGDDGDTTVSVSIDGGDGELSDEQRAALEAKTQELVQRIQQQVAEQRARGEGPFSLDGDPNTAMDRRLQQMEEAAAKARALQQEKHAMGEQFLADVQAQLEDSQLENWPRLERTLTRLKTLPRGRFDGESTDLIRVIDWLELEDAAIEAIGDSLEGYEIALHDALIRRNRYVAEAQTNIDDAINSGDSDEAIDIAERASRLRVAVRDVNTQYTDVIATALAENTARRFRDFILQTSYPRAYRPTVGQRAFAAAAELSDVDAETMETIQVLAEAHQSELALVNQQIRRAIDRHMPNETVQSIERLAQTLRGDSGGLISLGTDPSGPIEEAMANRDQLDERYMNQLYAVLTPEQAAKLPRPRSGPRSRSVENLPTFVETPPGSDSDG